MAYKKTIIPKKSIENPRNPENPLYKALTRLFSGPIVNYRHEQVRKYRRKELDKFNWISASGKEFKKADYEKNYSFYGDFMLNQNRSERYLDFEQMEFMPELNSALDIYADEMTTSTEVRNMLTIDCSNQEIKTALNILYYDILIVDLKLYGWARTLCKYGDLFLYLDVDEIFISLEELNSVEDYKNFEVSLSYNGVTFPIPEVTWGDIGKTIICAVTEINSGSTRRSFFKTLSGPDTETRMFRTRPDFASFRIFVVHVCCCCVCAVVVCMQRACVVRVLCACSVRVLSVCCV